MASIASDGEAGRGGWVPHRTDAELEFDVGMVTAALVGHVLQREQHKQANRLKGALAGAANSCSRASGSSVSTEFVVPGLPAEAS